MDTKTRAQARAEGLTRYFTGKPCSKGHVAERHLTGTCVECSKLAVAKWEATNPGKRRVYEARYMSKHRDRARAAALRWKRKQMGIPAAPYPCIGACENCGRVPKGANQMHLDHDHVTGAFRGWLCGGCNRGLGMLGDDIAGLERALAYLRRAPADERELCGTTSGSASLMSNLP